MHFWLERVVPNAPSMPVIYAHQALLRSLFLSNVCVQKQSPPLHRNECPLHNFTLAVFQTVLSNTKDSDQRKCTEVDGIAEFKEV